MLEKTTLDLNKLILQKDTNISEGLILRIFKVASVAIKNNSFPDILDLLCIKITLLLKSCFSRTAKKWVILSVGLKIPFEYAAS